MDQIPALMVVFLAVFALNLLPAFGPPTWAVLVLFSLHLDLPVAPLVLAGAVAAAGGRLLLARGTRAMAAHIPERQRTNLRAAGELVQGRPRGTVAFLALFALSPLPSAQLFEAAGLVSVRLLPLTAAFFAGRVVSYSLYLGGAAAVGETDTGAFLISGLTSPWGLALELVMLGLLVALARVDWTRLAPRQHDSQPSGTT